MRRFFLIIFFLCLFATVGFAQKDSLLIDWEFSRDSVSWQMVNIPHSCNALDGHSARYYRGRTYYNKILTIDKTDVKRPTFLLFEGAAQQATILLNDQKVTHHYGGYTAFTVELTGKLKVGENLVSVVCDNREDKNLIPVSSDFNKNNGLHNPVHLLQMNDLYLDPLAHGPYRMKAFSRHLADGEQLIIQTDVRCRKKSRKVDFEYRLKDHEGNIVMQRIYEMLVKEGERTNSTCEMLIENAHLWDGVNDPYLYTIEIDLKSGGILLDHTESRFGFRYFEMTPDRGFFLNGHPYPLRGVCIHQDMDERASAMTKADYDNDYSMVHELGANFVRLAHYPHNDYAFQLCDSLGIIVQTEIPWVNVCGKKASSLYFHNIQNMANEMVVNLFNHPSIVFWGLWNELDTWGNNDKLQGAIDFDRVKEQTRNAYDVIRYNDKQRFIGVTDCSVLRNEGYPELKANYFSENRYNGWYYNTGTKDGFLKFTDDMNEVHDKAPSHIVNVGEYGAGINPFCHTADTTALFDRSDDSKHYEEYGNLMHESHWQQICQMPWLNFTSAWVMFDFPVANRQEGYMDSDDGVNFKANNYRKYINDKGLVTRNRLIKKDVFYLYKAAWNKNETTVHITSKRLHKWPHGQKVGVKVYSNAQSLSLYQNGELKETLNSSGEVSGVIWQFKPLRIQTDKDIFRVVAEDGTEDEWQIIRE